MNSKYKFTIFTPCYNSEKFIQRVYNSLKNQTFKNFEWLVIDDASTDSTLELLRDYESRQELNIKLVVNQSNQMITKSFNKAITIAEGELFIPLGHDDTIKATTLETLNSIWGKHKSEEICGIWSMVKDQEGNLVGNPFEKDILIDNYFKIFKKYIWQKEKFPCMRTDVMKNHLFEHNELRYIPEGTMWGRIALKYNTIFVNEIFRTYYREKDNINALTKRSRKQISKSVLYQNEIWINEFFPAIEGNIYFKLRIYFAYAYYTFVEEKGFRINLNGIDRGGDKFIILIIAPFTFLIYLGLDLLKKN